MLTDPRNRGIEHFAGSKVDDAKAFNQWKSKAYNYIEKFAPGSKMILTSIEHNATRELKEEMQDMFNKLGELWDRRYTPEAFSHELKVLLTDHLDVEAAELIDDEESGIKAWKF